MNKNRLLISLLLSMISFSAFANRSINFDPDAIDDDEIPYYCVAITDTIEITLDDTWMNDPSVIFKKWLVKGNFQYVSGYDENSFPTIKIFSPTDRFPQDGCAKGRVTFKYKTVGCSSTRSIDFYKSFTLPDSIGIEGPECIIAGQVAVYSISPVLTKNLNDQIGMDTYFWNVLHSKQPFVDSVLYVSGDSSSVTLLISEQTENAVITVSVGQCNGQILEKVLGNATPEPKFEADTLFMPFGTDSFLVRLVDPNPDITYTWKNDLETSVEMSSNIGDSIYIIPSQNSKSNDLTISVEAEFNTITCNTSVSSVYIKRSWGRNVQIHELDSITCYVVGQSYRFNVLEDIPSSSKCKWILPQGWEFTDGIESFAQRADIRPTAAANLKDTLWVRPLDVRDTASAKKMVVYVKPAQIPIENIHVPGCLELEEINKAWIDTTSIKPGAKSYSWSVTAGEIVSGQGTDTIYFIPTINSDTLYVTAIGEDGCDNAPTAKALAIPPSTPTITADNECLFTGNHDNLTLTLHSEVKGQQYGWSFPDGWNPIYNTDSTVTLSSTGVRGTYDVYAWAIGSGACSASDSAHYEINVDTIEWEIRCNYYDFIDSYIFTLWINGSRNPSGQKADWYVNGSDSPMFSNTLSCNLGETTPNADSIMAVLTIDGCKAPIYWKRVGSPIYAPNRNSTNRLEQQKDSISFSILPNPANEKVILQIDKEGGYELLIFDTTGQIISSKNIYGSTAEINVSNIPEGIYFFVLTQDNRQYVQRVVIKH